VVSQTDAESVATDCLQAWTTGDLETARSLVHDDVTFVGPLDTADGIDAYMSGLQELAKIVRGADQKKVIAAGDHVCIVYDLLVASSRPVPTAAWYHVRDGKIASVSAFFDARSFPDTATGSVEGTSTESL
jgi:ketosteroid isomerase-like protein